MKDENLYKSPTNSNHKSQELNPSSSRKIVALQSFESQKLEDVESSIAQEEIEFSEIKRKQQLRKKSFHLADSFVYQKEPSQNLLGKINSDINNCNSHLLLGESISKRSEIVSINEIKRYEQKAKVKREGYRFPDKLDFTLKVNEVSSPKNNKSLKKSLSSSRFARQKLQNQQEKSIKSHQQQTPQIDAKENRNSLDLQSIKSSHQHSLQKSPSARQITYNNSYTLYPMAVPFSFQNINTTINNLQYLQLESNFSKSQNQVPGQKSSSTQEKQKPSLKKNKKKESRLLKQLNSSKYYIDAPLDMNEFCYQLDIEVNLEKNRGFQVYMISPQRKSDGIYFEDVMHFKYEMVKLPANMLRLRVYLLIQNEKNTSKQSKPLSKGQDTKPSPNYSSPAQKDWKLWKQIQLPIINQQKTEQQSSKKIKVSIMNMDLNWVLVKINNMMEFNLKLNHPQVPVGYYCLNQDFNGVQFTKLSLSGREKTKTTEELLGEGCQGKCQLI